MMQLSIQMPPKRSPEGLQMGQEASRSQDGSKGTKIASMDPQDLPKDSQDGPKGSQDGSYGPQHDPKRGQDGAQKGPQMAPIWS